MSLEKLVTKTTMEKDDNAEKKLFSLSHNVISHLNESLATFE